MKLPIVAVLVAVLLVAGCSRGGLDLADPVDVFKHATGSASLAKPPPTDLAAYLPGGGDSTVAADWPQPEAVVAGDIASVKLRFGFDRIEAPTLTGSKPAEKTGDNDIRVYELSISNPRLIAGDLPIRKGLCVLVLTSNALAQESDISALAEADMTRVWLPVTTLSSGESAFPVNEPDVKQATADGCVVLQESSILRVSPDGTSVERVGSWGATIDSIDGEKLSRLGNKIDDLEAALKARG